MNKNSNSFKQSLIHLRSDYQNYLQNHKSQGIPIKNLVTILQKYLKIQPTSLQTLVTRSIAKTQINWEDLLLFLQQEISLEDQVTKMELSKPSIIDAMYFSNPDHALGQKISEIVTQIKKKSTNCIKIITKTEFIGFKLLVVVLQKEIMFYDCEQKKIMRNTEFKYSNVKQKLLSSYKNKKKNNETRLFNPCVSQLFPIEHESDLTIKEQLDKVNPISKRTNDRHSTFKNKKNQHPLNDQKKSINIKSSKAGSIFSESEVNINQTQKFGRSVTMMESQSNPINLGTKNSKDKMMPRNISHRINRQKQTKEVSAAKKQYLKIRGNDTNTILRIITQSKNQGSFQTIKAYRNSIESFQKYIQIDRSKIEYEKEPESQKQPLSMNTKFDYERSIQNMKNQSKRLSSKKNTEKDSNPNSTKYRLRTTTYNENKRHEEKYRSASGQSYSSKSQYSETPNYHLKHMQGQHTSMFDMNLPDTFVSLEKKILEIQSVSFCDNYMLISLMNCQVRLYSFKRTIHGFSEQLIFEKGFSSIVNYVQIYKSHVRKQYNICIVLSKYLAETLSSGSGGQQNISKLQSLNLNIRTTHHGQKIKQTEILVFQLSSKMQIQKQSYSTYVSYSPILVNMLPLGIGGFTQAGQFFIIELNCTSRVRSQIKTVDTFLQNPQNGKKVSISCMKCHKNLVNLYIGCKDGSIYVYDLLASNVRTKNKISNQEILEIMLVNEGSEVLFWDVSGKIGIANSQTLIVSNSTSLINQQNQDTLGTAVKYFSMTEYFMENQFLVYGARAIGLISLQQNLQKKFHIEKPLKMFNRRQTLKNKRTYHTDPTNPQKQSQKGKKIHSYFNLSQSLIILSSDGQILIYDKNMIYIGSYFTLNYLTLTQCINCQSIKYLYLLHENNDMQVVNIYTQEQLISISNIRQQVYDIFFCNSSVSFCGYLSSKKYQLFIYPHTDDQHKSTHIKPLIQISLFNLILDISENTKTTQEQNNHSKISNKSNLTFKNIDIEIKFYKGSMIIIDLQKCIVLFLYKKSYTRNCMIKCEDHLETTDNLNIIHTSIYLQSSSLTLLLNNNTVFLINLQQKTLRKVYHLSILLFKTLNAYKPKQPQPKAKPDQYQQSKEPKPTKGIQNIQFPQPKFQPICHYLNTIHSTLTVIWKVKICQPLSNNQTIKYAYTTYSTFDSKQQLIMNITPTNIIYTTTQKQNNSNEIVHNWSSLPFLIGENMIAMSCDQNHWEMYNIKKRGQICSQFSPQNDRQKQKQKTDEKQTQQVTLNMYKIYPQ